MQDARLPTIRVVIGRKIKEVAARSNMDFHLDRKEDNTPHAIEQPVVVEYDDPQLDFRLPATRFVWISQQAGVVTEFETSPQLEFLSLEEAHRLALHLADLFSASGWHPSRRLSEDFNQIKAAVLDPERYWAYEHLYGEWREGTVVLQLTLRESGRGLPKEMKSHPVFVINVNFQDEKLQEEMQNRVYRARQEVNGDINKPLPLSFHLAH